MQYPRHWRMAFCAAFFFHLLIWLTGSFLLPHLQAAAVPATGTALEWTQVDDEEASSFKQISQTEVMEQAAPPAEKVTESRLPDQTPILAEDDVDTAQLVAQLTENLQNGKPIQTDIIVNGKGKQRDMGTAPVVITDYYPPLSDQVGFRGKVSLFVEILDSGMVGKVKVAVSSGKNSIDDIAVNAAKKWRFKPALDHEGKPMPCTKIMVIPFNMPLRK